MFKYQGVGLTQGMSGEGDGSLDVTIPVKAGSRVVGATLKAGESATYALEPSRHVYLVPATGQIEVNGVTLNARDGAAITAESELKITASQDAEIVLVDAA